MNETSTRTARQTLRVLFASALGILPLLQLLKDSQWLIEAWLSMAIVILPAALLRLRWRPHVVQLVPGLALLVFYLTNHYLAAHAWAGFVPTRSSWSDLRALSTALGHTVNDSVAPLQSTGPIRLFLCIGLAAFAIIVDLVAIELRRPALAGVPMLLIFTLSGAVPRQAVSWLWFALAGFGYLLILSSASAHEHDSWGQLVQRREGQSPMTLTSALSGRRIAVIAIAIAVLLPFLLPLPSVNVLANALHNGRPGVGGSGKGSGGVTIDPLATLRGSLTQGTPQNLFSVEVTGAAATEPFYLRTSVLDFYNGNAWVPGPDPGSVPARETNFATQPAAPNPPVRATQFTATVTVQKATGSAPLFAAPSAITSIPTGWSWNARYGLVVGSVTAGQHYTETVSQPDPSVAQLESAPAEPAQGGFGSSSDTASILARDLVADSVPATVKAIVSSITKGQTSDYDKAEALSSYFTNPANGFVYSLQTKGGESGSELVDFLTTGKSGFCQQYAAALGVMLRVAGIPARVIIGFSHPAPNAQGKFEVTTNDAHAWVEAYFSGIGWVPFDPTPLTGADAARAVALPWAPHANDVSDAATINPHPQAVTSLPNAPSASSSSLAAHSRSSFANDERSDLTLAIGALVLALLLAAASPALWRIRRRRQRLRRARTDGAEPLWEELADTSRDLGFGWSSSRTPRQVSNWLEEIILGQDHRPALRELALALEQHRYAGNSGLAVDQEHAADLIVDLFIVRRAMLASTGRAARMRALFLPGSLRRATRAQRRRVQTVARSAAAVDQRIGSGRRS